MGAMQSSPHYRRLARFGAVWLAAPAIVACSSIPAEFAPGEAPGIDVSLTPVMSYSDTTTGGGATRRLGYASAVAAENGFVYAVDSSIPAVVELDPGTGNPEVLLPLRDGNTAGLHVTPDYLLYVVDRSSRAVRELDSSGQLRRTFVDNSLIPTPVDVTVANWGSTVVIADELTQRISTFDAIAAPTGLLARTLSPVTVAASIRAISATARFIFVLDTAAREVTQLDLDGRTVATYGEDDLLLPVALAVDECRRIYVADGHGGGLFVTSPDFFGDSARASLPAELVTAVTDLWIDGNDLYVAAGVMGVHAFIIEPPCLAR